MQTLQGLFLEGLKAVPRRGLEVGGVLLGRVENGAEDSRTVIVEDFEAVNSEHRRGPSYTLSPKDKGVLEKQLARWRKAGAAHSVVGFYRSHTRPGLFLDQDDFELAREFFASPDHVFLLVRPSIGEVSTGGFFFWEDGDLKREAPYRTFMFHRGRLEASEPEVVRTSTPVDTPKETAPVVPPAVAILQAPRQKIRLRPWIPAVAALALAVTAIAVLAPGHRSAPTAAVPAETPAATPAALPAPANAPERLQLTAQRDGDDVVIRWNPDTDVIRRANRGVLMVEVAGRERRLNLNPYQLQRGYFRYRSSSGNLGLRLKVFPVPEPVTESVRASVGRKVLERPRATARDVEREEEDEESGPSLPRRRGIEHAAKPAPAPRREPLAPPAAPPGPSVEQENSADRMRPSPSGPSMASAAASAPPSIPAPVRTRRPSALATVSYDPVKPSAIRRAIGKVPGLSWLQRRRYKAGEDFTAAKAVRTVAPEIPAGVHPDDADVDLKVTVDRRGRISDTLLVSERANAELIGAAAAAASRWQFEPARLRDQPVESEVILHFRFAK
jgi:hypothetical protein